MRCITLRLPDDVHAHLVGLARQHNLSLNALLVRLLGAAAGASAEPVDAPLDDRLAFLRRQLGDLLVAPGPAAPVAPLPTPPDELRLEPPLSVTIIEEREDRL